MKKIKLIALFAALIAALGIYQFLKEAGKPQETPRTQVVVAAVDIPENTLITAEMVRLQPVATEALLANHVKDINSVVGMVLSSDVYAGEQIVTNRLVRTGEVDKNDTLAYVVEPGMRAITVSAGQASGISNMVKPGNHVDLVLNYSYEEEVESTDGVEAEKEKVTVVASRTLIQDVEVLAVDAVMSRDGSAEYATVTLQVSPEDAVKISFADYIGSIRLILRSSLDGEQTAGTEFDMDTLRGSKGGKR